jgi:hypothetical protein
MASWEADEGELQLNLALDGEWVVVSAVVSSFCGTANFGFSWEGIRVPPAQFQALLVSAHSLLEALSANG